MQKRKVGNKMVSGTVVSMIGLCFEIITMFFIVILFTILISHEYFKLSLSSIGGYFAHFISMFLGTVVIGRMATDKKMLLALLGGGGYLLAEISAVMLFFDGLAGRFVLNAVCSILGMLVGVLLISRPQKRNTNKKRISHR